MTNTSSPVAQTHNDCVRDQILSGHEQILLRLIDQPGTSPLLTPTVFDNILLYCEFKTAFGRSICPFWQAVDLFFVLLCTVLGELLSYAWWPRF